ncbi:MAG: transporter substrate-binding domain-containing protein [Campylobacterota bacterium]|nr:transporter substrate-binding domain-containing protein [Campylobacterota bacterium]
MKKLLFIILIAASLFASQNAKLDIYTEHYPPYNYMENGKLKGISVEVLDAMLQIMNSTNLVDDVILTNWSRAYTIAKKKKNAMVFATTRTESRERFFKWVGPIVKSKVGVIAPKNKNIKVEKISDFNNYKVGAVLKDVGELLLLENGVNKKNIQYVKGTDAINISFNKMENNRIDMFAYSIDAAFANAKMEGFDTSKYEIIYTLKEGELYFAFNKDTDDAIIKRWQRALDTIKKNGTYAKIVEKY